MNTAHPYRGALALAALGTVVALAVTACAAGPYPAAADLGTDHPGFWLGLWHGLITPVTFIISLFTDAVRIYAVPNSGNWYDAGYVLGVMIAFSGPANRASAAGRRGRPRAGR